MLGIKMEWGYYSPTGLVKRYRQSLRHSLTPTWRLDKRATRGAALAESLRSERRPGYDIEATPHQSYLLPCNPITNAALPIASDQQAIGRHYER
jgi:hypothetical protein